MVISRRRFAQNGKEMYRNKKARGEGTKLLFLFIKYAKSVPLSRLLRRKSLTPYCVSAVMKICSTAND